MLSVPGTYEDNVVILTEPPPFKGKFDVIVTFLQDSYSQNRTRPVQDKAKWLASFNALDGILEGADLDTESARAERLSRQ